MPVRKLYSRPAIRLFLVSWRSQDVVHSRPGDGRWDKGDGTPALIAALFGETHAIWTQGGDLFTRVTSPDAVKGTDGQEHVSDQATIWRWREAYQNEFAGRVDWTVKDFAHANHNPELVVNSVEGKEILELEATEGETITLDAKGSNDPDGQAIHYHWWVYREAGLNASHGADLSITDEDEQRATARIKSALHAQLAAALSVPRGRNSSRHSRGDR